MSGYPPAYPDMQMDTQSELIYIYALFIFRTMVNGHARVSPRRASNLQVLMTGSECCPSSTSYLPCPKIKDMNSAALLST